MLESYDIPVRTPGTSDVTSSINTKIESDMDVKRDT